jgi:hypothetical protein
MCGAPRILTTCCLAMILGAAIDARPRQVGAPPPSVIPAGSGSISGVVTDGVTKRPLAGVVVQLVGPTGRNQSFSARLISDSKGRFVFRQVPASPSYVLTTSKFGYIDGGLARREVSVLLSGSRVPVPLADGEWIADANVLMWRLGGISGTVVDEKGEAVVGIPVRVLARIPVAGQMQLAAGPAVKTDDRGYYRVAGLSRGSYIVTVPSVQSSVPASTSVEALAGMTRDALTSATATGPISQPPNSAGLDVGASRLVIGNYGTPPPPVIGATPIDLKDGEERQNIDFTLQPVPTARLSGQVTGPSEVLTGLVVRLLPEGSEGLGAGSEQVTALAGPDGSFSFVGVPAGSYTVAAKGTVTEFIVRGASIMAGLPATPGMVNTAGSGSSISSAPGGTMLATRNTTGNDSYSGNLRLDVGSDDVSNIVVALKRGATLSGQFVYDGTARPAGLLRASVEPATGSAVLGVATPSPRPGSAPTEAFSIAGLKNGEYFLRVTAGPSLIVRSIIADGGDFTDRPFDASSGTDITGVVVTLTDKVASLAGVVRDASGVLARQAAVIAFPADKTLWTRFGFEPPRIQSTSFFGTGGYRIPRLPKGDYFVIAMDVSMLEAWKAPGFFAAASALATRVTLDWGVAGAQDLTISQVTIK